MKPLFLFLAALLTCGFVVQTPESRKALEQARQQWHRETASRYDKRALHAFLLDEIAKHPGIEGASLQAIAADAKFRPAKDLFYWKAGQWLFVTKDPAHDLFELRGYLPEKGWLVLRCKREARQQFTLIESLIDSTIVLCPPAYTFAP